MAEKKIPLRMCIVCRNMKDKKELIRVVKNSEGKVFIDKTFKSAGRGAYVCNTKDCILKCVKTKALNRAYKTAIDNENYKCLEEYIKD